MRHLPPVVVFDLGGVLVQFDEAPLYEVFRPDVTHAIWWEFVLHSPTFRGFETGTFTTEQMAAVAVPHLCRAEVDIPTFLRQLSLWPAEPFPGARDIVQRVRTAGFRTLMLSNTNPLHWGILKPKFADLFDHCVLSFETGWLKPNPEAFAVVEQFENYRGSDILFFDDNLKNIAAARARGWNAIAVSGPHEIASYFDEFGVSPAFAATLSGGGR